MEKAITMYDVFEMKVVGLIIVDEIELGYIKDKIIIFTTDKIKQAVFALLESFGQRYINTHNLNKELLVVSKNVDYIQNIHFLESFNLKSNNKNKSSRFKRMLEHMDLSHLERFDYESTRNV